MYVFRKAFSMRSRGNRAPPPPKLGVAFARSCAVVMLFAFALTTTQQVCAGGETDSPASAPTIYSKSTKVRIPLRTNEAAMGAGMQLVFSRDGGRTWKVHDKW